VREGGAEGGEEVGREGGGRGGMDQTLTVSSTEPVRSWPWGVQARLQMLSSWRPVRVVVPASSGLLLLLLPLVVLGSGGALWGREGGREGG